MINNIISVVVLSRSTTYTSEQVINGAALDTKEDERDRVRQ
jgi:hypothetical protein